MTSWASRSWLALQRSAEPATYKQATATRTATENSTTARVYDGRSQRRRLLINSLGRQVCTAALCPTSGLVLLAHSQPKHLINSQRYTLNSLTTILNIAIGLNFTAAFRSYARLLRWRILAASSWRLYEFDLILRSDEQSNIVRLMLSRDIHRSSKWPGLSRALCFLWVLLNASGAILIAILSLTYSIEQGKEPILGPWKVSVLDLSNESLAEFAWINGGISFPQITYPLLLHEIGEPTIENAFTYLESDAGFGDMRNCDEHPIEPGHSGEFEEAGVQCIFDHYGLCRSATSCFEASYTFSDLVLDGSRVLRKSDRVIRSRALCETFELLAYDAGTSTLLYGNSRANYTRTTPYFALLNDTRSHSIKVTGVAQELGFDGPPVQWPMPDVEWGAIHLDDPNISCGATCATVLSFPPNRTDLNRPYEIGGHVIECNNTIDFGTMFTDHSDLPKMTSASAKRFAGAMARYKPPVSPGNVDWPPDERPWVIYRAGFDDWPHRITYDASSMVNFTLKAFATSDGIDTQSQSDRRIKSPHWAPAGRVEIVGQTPFIPLILETSWHYTIAILTAVPLIQLFSLLCVVFWANGVAVLDDSDLVMARLLLPISEKLRDKGSLMSNDDIIQYLGEDTRYKYDHVRSDGLMQTLVRSSDEDVSIKAEGLQPFRGGFTTEFLYKSAATFTMITK